jgi:hypothetical protein
MAHPGDAHHNARGLVVTRPSENYHPLNLWNHLARE